MEAAYNRQQSLSSEGWATSGIMESWDLDLKLNIWSGIARDGLARLAYTNGRAGIDFQLDEVEMALRSGLHVLNEDNSHWDVVDCNTDEWGDLVATLLEGIRAITQ